MSNGDQGPDVTPNIDTITVTVTDIACPDVPTELPFQALDPFFRDMFCQFNKTWGLGRWTSELLAGFVVSVAGIVIVLTHVLTVLLKPVVFALGEIVFGFLDDLRKSLDPAFGRLAEAVLNELLGTDFNAELLATGTDINAHLARAQQIGLLFHRQIMSEFLAGTGITLDAAAGSFTEPTGPTGAVERVTPTQGIAAAARFTGLAVNFATANGIIATLAGLFPEVHLDEIREIGEEVAKNLGLGRLQRLALAPLVQILLAEPYKWYINEIGRPTQFKLADVANPFTGSVMPQELIWRSLAREGYSDDKIQALLELHRVKPSASEYLTLFAGGQLTYDTLLKLLGRLGYSDDGAVTKAEALQLQAQRPFQDEIRTAAVTAYADGHITREELQAIVNQLPLSADEKALVMIAADYKRKVPNKHLSLAQIESAFEQGILDLGDFTDQLTNLGYSPDDQNTLLLLTLIKLDKQKEAAAAKAAKAAMKAAKSGGGATTPPTPTTP